MVEGRTQPAAGVVALLATLREIRRHVIRIRRTLEIFQVTRHAGGAGQVVIIVDVAVCTLPWRNRVRTRQRKP